jgi:hypothetical protein
MSRCEWTELTQNFDGKYKGKYGELPYNASILAKAIQELYNLKTTGKLEAAFNTG